MREDVFALPRGLYLHIPFCRQKCRYCAFYSLSEHEATLDRYLQALIAAMNGFQPHRRFEIDSVYFGGGTPSLLGSARLSVLLSAIRARFDLSRDTEITLEANPGTVDKAFLQDAYAMGINRLSLGVQSLQDDELKALGRIHSAQQAIESITAAHEAGFQHLSADLMLGIPNQSQADFEDSFRQLVALPIDHLSAYLLSVEPGTPFAEDASSLHLPDEDTMAERYLSLCRLAEGAGFKQYEVSNFAKPGGQCRHNLHYWHGEEYLAFGPSAHGFLDGRRYAYAADLEHYIQSAEVGVPFEDLGGGGDWEEIFFLGMRLSEGIHLGELEKRFAVSAQKIRQRAIPYIKAGFLHFENDRLSFAPTGFSLSNQLLAELLY